MYLHELSTVEKTFVTSIDGKKLNCFPPLIEWVVEHSWIIYGNKKKQKHQKPFDPAYHYFLLLEIEEDVHIRICDKTFVAGGSNKCTGHTDSNEWTFFFRDEVYAEAMQVSMKVYEKETIKDVLPYFGMGVRTSGIYNSKFCEVHRSSESITVKEEYKDIPFSYSMSKKDAIEEKTYAVLMELIYHLKEYHIRAFESLVQTEPTYRFDFLRTLFCKHYLHCLDIDLKKLPGAHQFKENAIMTEKSLRKCHDILIDDKVTMKIGDVMDNINKYLCAWELGAQARRVSINEYSSPDEVEKKQKKMTRPTYRYMDIQPNPTLVSVGELYGLMAEELGTDKKNMGFNPKDVEEYTNSIDTLLLRSDTVILYVQDKQRKPHRFIKNFKELIHLLWFMDNRFQLAGSKILYQDNGCHFGELSARDITRLRNLKITLMTYD